MEKKTTNWLVLFHSFDENEKFLSAKVFHLSIKAGKESSVFSWLASFPQSEPMVWERLSKELVDNLDEDNYPDPKYPKHNILVLLLGDLRHPREKNRLVSFARID